MRPRRFGIMQGRLSPRDPALLQAFPQATWREEFQRAEELGFVSIEWLVDDVDLTLNPLFHSVGRRELERIVAQSGVTIDSLCAHVLMEGGLEKPGARGAAARTLLGEILQTSADFGIANVALPIMERASVRNSVQDAAGLAENLRMVLSHAPGSSMICLEGDLPAGEMIHLLDRIDHEGVGVCYDLGNATALGFDPAAEIFLLGDAIREVHIKDRVLGGASVTLGQGDTAFGPAFRALTGIGFSGNLILETPVGDDWCASARSHLDFAHSVDAALWGTAQAC